MSLPLNVLPSPQMLTSSSFMARTSIVPVTARPIGVVLKYGTPAVEMWNAPHCSIASPSETSCARQSIEPRLLGAVLEGAGAGSLRSRARQADRDSRCRRTGSRPSAASNAAPRWCRGRRKTRCRLSRRREGPEGWSPCRVSKPSIIRVGRGRKGREGAPAAMPRREPRHQQNTRRRWGPGAS